MTSITIADVAPYFTQYQAKYNAPCTLNLDLMEEIMGDASTDDEMLTAMHEAMTDDEGEGNVLANDISSENDDRSAPEVIETGSAWDYAKKMDDPEFQADLETNALAALENKRGGAVIGRDLIRLYGRSVIEGVWPIPGSTEKTHPGSNRLDRRSKVVKDAATGESKNAEVSWYVELFDGSPAGKALEVKRTSVKAAKAGETGKHILPEHAKLAGDEIKLTAEIAMLDGMRNNKKNAIVRAVNLIQRMARLNEETEMTVEMITEDGTPEGVPVKSNKLIYAFNSKDRKQFRILTIGQLLALDVDKAKGSGGTYTAVIGTTGRKPKSGTGAPVQNIKVETIPAFDDVTAEYAHFFERLRSDTKAMNAFLTHLNGAGSDDILLSLNGIMNDIDSYLSKPAYAKRLQGLLTAEREQSKVA